MVRTVAGILFIVFLAYLFSQPSIVRTPTGYEFTWTGLAIRALALMLVVGGFMSVLILTGLVVAMSCMAFGPIPFAVATLWGVSIYLITRK